MTESTSKSVKPLFAAAFIAAGLIFVKGGDVRNITTAANIWLATAIGIACGAGQWLLVAVAMMLGLALLVLLRALRPWLKPVDEG